MAIDDLKKDLEDLKEKILNKTTDAVSKGIKEIDNAIDKEKKTEIKKSIPIELRTEIKKDRKKDKYINYKDKYDVFLSYRRDGGETMAILLRDRLVAKGYRVFLDVENLRSGDFNEKLLQIIQNCTDFIVVLSAGSLDRCVNDGDWVRREIAHALSHDKNVVPLLLRGFEWPETLPKDISQLANRGGVNTTTNEFFDAVINRLTDKFLKSTPRIQKTKKEKEKNSHPLRPLKWIITSLSIIAVIIVLAVTALIIVAMVTDPEGGKTFWETINDFWENIKKSVQETSGEVNSILYKIYTRGININNELR